MERVSSLASKVLPGHEFYEKFQKSLDMESEIFQLKMNYAKVLVSLWSYSCHADGVFHRKEGNLVGQMVKAMFDKDCIFDHHHDQKAEIIEELSEVFESPLPVKMITDFAEGNPVLAANFYEDAVCIVTTDGKFTDREKEFLEDLAKELEISPMDKKNIDNKYTGGDED
ncbi:TerB family tellurite resistance protein [Leptospira sarikeiensis]|uniref:TerB family tellurite resistance protein n=1 Tax=Leptospira sarikeiensis TaxID=2484943 RepID=A0A4R9K3R3_9LEPT|nr:TerB family tellurite resistance protein [Leptospira sarikeiensis]TGL60696.1 TerB family tellurite resistance protein [Leptospira sarikeiensis]